MNNTNTIIKEIHSSFSSAESELMKEVEAILADAKDEDAQERASALSSLGFGESKPVKALSEENIKRAEDLKHYKERYSRIAPQYKFISREKVKEICQKYKIVMGPSQLYVEDIPEKNQQDILNFEILDDSFLEINNSAYENAMWNGKSHPKEMGSDHIRNCLLLMIRRSQEVFGNTNLDPNIFRAMITELTLRGESDYIDDVVEALNTIRLSFDVRSSLLTPYNTTPFFVAADINSFNRESQHIEDGVFLTDNKSEQELTKEIEDQLWQEYDPIVLAKVQGGFLVVTAWGDEASDPDVHNENLN